MRHDSTSPSASPNADPTTGRAARHRLRLVGLATTVLATVGCTVAAAPTSGSPDRSAAGPPDRTAPTCTSTPDEVAARLEAIERRADAVVGVHAVDTGTGEALGYRSDERFAFASTIKALAAAVVLDRTSGRDLSRRLRWTEDDLVPYSPVTEQHVDDGLTVREVLDAAVTVSDNTAANLMFDLIGGPQALDRALAEVGDPVTDVVRREPELNDFVPGDVRDTTTPRAIVGSLAAFAVGGELARADERHLDGLLLRNTTGDDLIRSVVPAAWRVGDKTGTASYGTRNDIAVLSPPGREPIVMAVLTRQRQEDAAADDALVASAAAVVVDGLCG